MLMVDRPKRTRQRATTSPIPVWAEQLQKLREPTRQRDHLVIDDVPISTESLESLLERFAADGHDPEAFSSVVAQFISRGSRATDGLLSVVEATPIDGPFRLARAALRALREIHDDACVEPLINLLHRHSTDPEHESLCSSIIHTLSAFVFDLHACAPPALWNSHDEAFRANLLETCAIARVPDVRALEILIAELDEQPLFASALLGEWGNQKAVPALRERLARIDPQAESDWMDTSWSISEALLRLGAELSDAERALRRRAVSAQPEGLKLVGPGLVHESADMLRVHTAATAKILVDHAGEVAAPLLRRQLSALVDAEQQTWPPPTRDLKWATDIIVLVDAIGQVTEVDPHEKRALDDAMQIVNTRLDRFKVDS